MPNIINIQNLRKVYGTDKKKQVVAVDDISLQIKAGEIFGLLGPNGAGKTTTMRMLTTLLLPTSGTVEIAGLNLVTQEEKVRTKIGYVSQSGGLERSATGRENLLLQAQIFGANAKQARVRVDELIHALGLEEFVDRLVKTYSGGQRRRVDIALGMVHRPEILFLDEPTAGLDPSSRAKIWEVVKKLAHQGMTIIMSTHYLDEADALCEHVAIIDHGRVITYGSPAELKREIGGDIVILRVSSQAVGHLDTQKLKSEISGVKDIIIEHGELHLVVDHGEQLLPTILRYCDSLKIVLSSIALHHPTLDDVFLQKTGRTFEQ
ncbi:MAG TPA: ATP-binding cassette domain-containing protein [Candidatus Babeliales bacterium]|nr:ATP-binding cassette domain-containing protein [Candidatus Babeliales bacterium]